MTAINSETIRCSLTQQALLTTTRIYKPAHLYFLANICIRAGLPEAANLCLDALERVMAEADRLWAASIVAVHTGQHKESRLLLENSIEALLLARGKPVNLAPHYEELVSNGPTHLATIRKIAEWYVERFSPLFDDLILPALRSDHTAPAAKLYHFHFLKNRWLHCPLEDRSALIAKEAEINDPSHVLSLMKGHDAWLSSKRDKADRHHRKARAQSLAGQFPFIHYNCGTYTWLPRATCNRLGSTSGFTPVPDHFSTDS